MRAPSLASWRQNALDLVVEACQLVAALRPLPPGARRQLEEQGLAAALGWLRETHPGPSATLAGLLDETAVLDALGRVELPPPWDDPPEQLRERLSLLDARARAALRHHELLAAPLLAREGTLPWPAPSPGLSPLAPPAAPSRPSPPTSAPSPPSPGRRDAALQAQARQRLGRLLASAEEASKPASVDKTAAPAVPPSASLRLSSRGGLSWCLPQVASLDPEAPAFTLQAGAARVTLLASNLRSGATSVPVPPSTEDYRLTPVAASGALVVPLLPGLEAAQASAFRVRSDGTAERALDPQLREGQRWRLLVPPSLAGVSLPGDAWSLGGGWRALEVHLAAEAAPAQAALLDALGLEPPAASVRLSWYGVAPIRYRQAAGGKRLAVFAERRPPLLQITRRGVAGRVVLLLTSERANVSLDLEETEAIVALDDLEPGAFCLDLVPDDPQVEPAQLSFFIEREEAHGPTAMARAWVASREVSLHDDPEITCSLRGDERLILALPPLWPVRLRVRSSATRGLGRRSADAEGHLDLSGDLASLVRGLGRSTVADVVVDAGELGQLTLAHERPFDPAGTLAELLALLQERRALLACGSLDLLQAAWIEPLCRALGYELSERRQATPDDPYYRRMTILARQGRLFEQQVYALLFVSTEPPSAEVLRRAARHAQAPRALWTDGLRWRLTEQGRRHAGERLDLDLSSERMTRVSLERLIARLGV